MAAKKSKPPILTLTPEQESEANHKIKRFMEDRFELDLGSFEAAEILELFTREIAPHYYNRAIFDVQTHLKERFESIESDLWALEKIRSSCKLQAVSCKNQTHVRACSLKLAACSSLTKEKAC